MFNVVCKKYLSLLHPYPLSLHILLFPLYTRELYLLYLPLKIDRVALALPTDCTAQACFVLQTELLGTAAAPWPTLEEASKCRPLQTHANTKRERKMKRESERDRQRCTHPLSVRVRVAVAVAVAFVPNSVPAPSTLAIACADADGNAKRFFFPVHLFSYYCTQFLSS